MLRRHPGRSLLAVLGLTLCGLAAACDSAPTAAPLLDELAAPLFDHSDNAALTEQGTFTFSPPALPVNAPCVDPDAPLRMIGTWSGFYRDARTADGRLHTTEHVDWSDVIIVADDGRTWTPAPGAHESFSFIVESTPDGNVQRQNMHNLRARFLGQDGDPDLQVWHTIRIIRGPDGELRVFDVVLPFEARCLGG